MKALVTGATGFIGKHLVGKLTGLGWELTGRNEDCDVVFHLAGSRNEEVYEANVVGTAEVLRMAVDNHAEGFVFTSSCAAAQPVNDYGMSKKLAEELCQWYREKYWLDVIILRLFNVYGPGDTKSDVARFVEAIRTGIPPKIYGKDCVRDYVHVDDVVQALISAATANRDGGVPVDVGTGNPTSIQELWDLCQRIAGTEMTAQYLSSEKDLIPYSVAPGSAEPCISLRDGLKTVLPIKELCESY